MTDFVSPALPEAVPQVLDLIYDQAIGPGQLLRPIEPGDAYYNLMKVERQLPADFPEQRVEDRAWEGLGLVYLHGGTLQTLRWGSTPGSFHVGRVPAADRYRLRGEQHAYLLSELVETLARGPVAFRGYPVTTPQGETTLQPTPALPGEVLGEPTGWAAVQRRLLAGESTQRDGQLYQLYEEVDEEGLSTGSFFIGCRAPAGEWLVPHSAAELAAVGGEWRELLPEA